MIFRPLEFVWTSVQKGFFLFTFQWETEEHQALLGTIYDSEEQALYIAFCFMSWIIERESIDD